MRSLLALCAVVSMIGLSLPQVAQAHFFGKDTHFENAKKAKITFIEAIEKAQEKQAGTLTRIELEKGHNGKLYYEVNIVKDGEDFELHVDAGTGSVTFETR